MTEHSAGLLDWTDRAADVTANGVERRRQASAEECVAVAGALDIAGCASLVVNYRLEPLAKGRVLMTGRMTAQLIRTCVVELDDFEQTIDEQIDIEFWPEVQLTGTGSAYGEPAEGHESAREIAIDALEGEDPEPIRNGRLAVGAVVYQLLAATLDPFPRSPGATLETTEAEPPVSNERQNPFAVLQNLKPGDGRGGKR